MKYTSTAAFMAVLTWHSHASAQNTVNYSASDMWGTSPAGIAVPGATDSSIAHVTNGVLARQIRDGENILGVGAALGPPGDTVNNTINAIGSQSIVSNTIFGENNSVSIDAEQEASNTGNVDNAGQVLSDNSGTNTNNFQ